MNPSENILQHIRMFVTDADGTLVGQKPEFELYRAFRVKINDLRNVQGAAWVVCTGRGLRSYSQVTRSMRVFGIEPDYVITRHAFIFQRSRYGYWPHWVWNIRTLWLQVKDTLQVRRALPMLSRTLMSRNPFARVLFRSPQRICFRFDDDGAANFGAEIVRNAARPYKYLQIFKHDCDLDVRMVPFTKGLAVAELARHIGIAPSQILVVGDGHNDISMMTLNADCRTACPSNAVPEVIEVVSKTGGHIATQRSLAGVMEIIGAYETGQIHSELPASLVALKGESGGFPIPSHSGRSSGRYTGLFLLLAVLYTTILVLASFDLIPFGAVIRRPYQTLLQKIEQAVRNSHNK